MTGPVVCVRTGTAYGPEYVERLARMVRRHTSDEQRVVCLTDRPDDLQHLDVEVRDISWAGLPGWWAKLLVLDPSLRGPGRAVFLDLDTVVCGPLAPLWSVPGPLALSHNFTAQVRPNHPCTYGSCIMVIDDDWGRDMLGRFLIDKNRLMRDAGQHGDQWVIERLARQPIVTIQDHVPPRYIIGRRDFPRYQPEEASIMVFAGAHKPHNTPHGWLRKLWEQ